jgi:hypothetical protein
MLFDNLTHTQRKFVMSFPFVPHDHNGVILRVSVDNVQFNAVLLQEAVDSVDCLNEVIEFVCRANKDSFVAVTLKVAA